MPTTVEERYRVTIVDPQGVERSASVAQGATGALSVGRAPENALQVVSPYVSRRHAQLWPQAEGLLYEDLDSTSGSYVAGSRIERILLKPGDLVHLGSPDGLPLRVHAPEGGGDGRTEVLRVTDIQGSLYLSSSGPVVTPGVRRKDSHQHTEERLRSLISLTGRLLEVSDIDGLSELLLDRVLELLPVDRGMVLLADKEGLVPRVWGTQGAREPISRPVKLGPLELGDHIGPPPPGITRTKAPFTPIRTVINRVFSEGVGLLSLDATSDQRLEGSKSVVLQAVRSIMAAPIGSATKNYGVLYVDTHRSLRKEDEDALDWLVAVARQAGLVMDRLQLLEEQRSMMESMMRGLAASIDARDGLTAGHSARVAHYSVGTAQALGLSVQEQYAIYYAALLHDYGKIGVDDAVLKKPGKLTDDEYEHIKLHPVYSYDILSKIEFPPHLADLPMMAATHHERMDGKGYPWGLTADQIPLAGRIIAISDVYDSLTRKRHYREPMPQEEVLAHLEEGRGSRFDATVLDAFFAYHDSELAERERRREAKRARTHPSFDTTTRGGGEATVDAVSPAQAGRLDPFEDPDESVRPTDDLDTPEGEGEELATVRDTRRSEAPKG